MLALIPFLLTYYILLETINAVNNIIKEIYSNIDKDFKYYFNILVISIITLIIYIGYLIDKHQNSFILKLMENITNQIPVLKDIYNIFKNLLTIFNNDKNNYLGVVEIAFAGYTTYAFITKEENNQLITFVPTSPNPTSGYVIILDKKKEVEDIKNIGEWKKTDISPQKAMSKIISLGFK